MLNQILFAITLAAAAIAAATLLAFF